MKPTAVPSQPHPSSDRQSRQYLGPLEAELLRQANRLALAVLEELCGFHGGTAPDPGPWSGPRPSEASDSVVLIYMIM